MIVSIISTLDNVRTVKNVRIIRTKTNSDATISIVLEVSDQEEIVIPPRELLAVYPDNFWDENGNQLF